MHSKRPFHVLNAVLLVSSVCAQTDAPRTPVGFRPAAEPEIWRLGPHELEDVSYVVSKLNSFIRVESREDWVTRVRREAKAVSAPPKVTIDLGNARGHWSPGIGTQVQDGWIHGWAAGEFGGALYWFSTDGSTRQKINSRNTRIVSKQDGRVFAVQALSHFRFSYSSLIEVVRNTQGWTTRLVTDLHDVPDEIMWDESRFIIATGSYITTLEVDGRHRELYRAPREIMADGLVKVPNGEFWMGSSRCVLCLKPSQNGDYRAFWFRPLEKPKGSELSSRIQGDISLILNRT